MDNGILSSSKKNKLNFVYSVVGFGAWIFITLTNYLFSLFFNTSFSFSPLKYLLVPLIIILGGFLAVEFRIFKFFLPKGKVKIFTHIFFTVMNGVYATYICVTQHSSYNGFSLLFAYVIGLTYCNGALGLKGTIVVSASFFLMFYSLLNFLKLEFGSDEIVLTYFFAFSGIIFGFFSETTIQYNKKQKENIILKENYANNLEKEVEIKTRNIKTFVESLDQGFMILNKEGIIQKGTTEITKDLFEMDPEDKNFCDVLRLKSDERKTVSKWLNNIWKGFLSFKDLNPLGPQSFKNSMGSYIDLEYKAIYLETKGKRKIDKIICIATDKTQEVQLEKRLEQDKQKAKFITTCLQNPVEFIDLLDESYNLLGTYQIIWDMDEKELFRKFHTLKARYGQFGVKSITSLINKIETAISEGMKSNLDFDVTKFKEKLKLFVKENRLIIEAANKFIVDQGSVVQVSEILNNKERFLDLESLYDHLKSHYLNTDIKLKFERYRYMVDEIANSQNKFIELFITGDEIKVDTELYTNFINASIHLFRNMVDHGIETEDIRIEKAKPRKGQITIDFKNNDKTFLISIKDDGEGINSEKIREKILEKRFKPKEIVEKMGHSELINMIFYPGLSTKEEMTDLSGRGVGMDAVKAEVEILGGTISVSSTPDKGTTFFINLPKHG